MKSGWKKAILTWLAIAWLLPCLVRGESTRPNVLFIAIDDLNDWTGVLGGHPQARTPNLDRLAQQGVLFTRAYCDAPACNPSRVAVLTGIRPATSGVYRNSQPWRPVLPTAVTLPQHFAAHGYRVLGAGKIFHARYPDPASWDEYFPSKTKTVPNDPMPGGRPVNGIPETGHFDWGPVPVRDAEMGDAQVVAWVADQLAKEHPSPLFLACGIFRPHLPWYVPQAYFDAFPLPSIELPAVIEGDLDDVPEAGRQIARPWGDHRKVLAHHQWQSAVRGYLASIAFADQQLGKLLEALEASPERDHTIVVLWTDHGWHLGEKEHWRKFALWEEATHTPLIFVVPEKCAPGLPAGTPAGTRCARTVNLSDIYPTLIELCGLTPRSELQGTSLVPLLQDSTAPWDRPAVTTHQRGNHAIRDERFRYIRYADGSEELYDHQADPHEWKNLAGEPDYQQVQAELARSLPKSDAPEAPPAARYRNK